MRKICATCGARYSELDNYCTKCGIFLEKEPNACSELKTALCKNKIFRDDDLYCSICGAPTVYAREKIEESKRW